MKVKNVESKEKVCDGNWNVDDGTNILARN